MTFRVSLNVTPPLEICHFDPIYSEKMSRRVPHVPVRSRCRQATCVPEHPGTNDDVNRQPHAGKRQQSHSFHVVCAVLKEYNPTKPHHYSGECGTNTPVSTLDVRFVCDRAKMIFSPKARIDVAASMRGCHARLALALGHIWTHGGIKTILYPERSSVPAQSHKFLGSFVSDPSTTTTYSKRAPSYNAFSTIKN